METPTRTHPHGRRIVRPGIETARGRRARFVPAVRSILLGGTIAVLVLSAIHVSSWTSAASATAPDFRGSSVAASFPTPVRHVVVIFMENANASWVLKNGSYQDYLAHHYAYANSFYSTKHGSNADYFAATSGLNATVLKEYKTANLADLTAAKGLTWGGFEQSMPKPCDAIKSSKTAPYNSGHNPFVWYSDVFNPASYCNSHDVSFVPLQSDIQSGTMPNYALVVANQTSDAHNVCPGAKWHTAVSCGDAWLRGFLTPLLNGTASWVRSTAFFIVYDEANTSDHRGIRGTTGGGIVYAAAVGNCATPHLWSTTPYATYSVLTTTEWLLGLGTTGHHDGPSNPPMKELFNSPTCGSSASSFQ